jgi:DNA-binding NtrC family response regulator
MKNQEKISVLLVEKDNTVAESIEKILKTRSYATTQLSKKDEALSLLKERGHPLAIIGDTEGNGSSFEVMREIVITSPIISMILITNLPKKEVDEMAEGYGILGHVNRRVPPDDMISLLERFEDIYDSLIPSKK